MLLLSLGIAANAMTTDQVKQSFTAKRDHYKKKGYIIDGYIKGIPDGAIIYLTREYGTDTINKCISKQGKFTFKGVVPKEAEFYFLKLDTSVSKKGSKAILMVNDKVTISGNLEKWPLIDVTGSPAHSDFFEFAGNLDETKLKRRVFLKKIGQINRQLALIPRVDTLITAPLIESRTKIFEELEVEKVRFRNYIIDFIGRKSDSFYTPYLIESYTKGLDEKEILALYQKLSINAKGSYYGLQLKDFIDSRRAIVGNKIGDFTGMNQDGKPISLNSVLAKNKVVLLDFWASWCAPCREENPNLKRVYEMFHDRGFDILSASTDKDRNKWLRALKDDAMTWHQIIGNQGDISFNKLFNIKALPFYLLLDSEGTVLVADHPGEGAESLRGKDLEDKVRKHLKL